MFAVSKQTASQNKFLQARVEHFNKVTPSKTVENLVNEIIVNQYAASYKFDTQHTANGLALLFPECTLLPKYKEFFFNVKTEVEGKGDKSWNYLSIN